MLAAPCPVLHEAVAVWHPPLWSSGLHCPASPALSPGVAGRSTTFLCPPGAWKGSEGALGACLALPAVPSIAPARDPRTRGAAFPISQTKHKGMPCLARACLTEGFFCPRKLPSLNTRHWAISPWVGAHWNAWHQSWKRTSGCMGSELEWEKGSAERTDSRSRFIHPVIQSFIHSCNSPEYHQHRGQKSEQAALPPPPTPYPRLVGGLASKSPPGFSQRSV